METALADDFIRGQVAWMLNYKRDLRLEATVLKTSLSVVTKTVLRSDTGRRTEAEETYSDALIIYRELAVHDLSAFGPYIGITLINLSHLQRDAEGTYSEAVAIHRTLSEGNQPVHVRLSDIMKETLRDIRRASTSPQ